MHFGTDSVPKVECNQYRDWYNIVNRLIQYLEKCLGHFPNVDAYQ